VQKASAKRAADGASMTDDERRKLLSTEQSLGMESSAPRLPTAIEGLETFSLTGTDDSDDIREDDARYKDADSFFNLPGDTDDEDDDDRK